MATRDANQSAGVQSGLTEKAPIGNYTPREQNEKTGKPKTQKTESAGGPFKIK